MKKKNKAELWLAFAAIVLIYVVVVVLEQVVESNHIIFTVLKKGAIYSLVAVSMNLLNGFTGLFSLGQAGFMLIGAYTYSIFTMPTEIKLTESVYKYYEAAVKFDTGIFVGLVCAGLAAALFAALIGLPVLRLKSDYLAIATIGFAEIIRAIFQWDVLGPITNGANVMRNYLDLTDVKIPFTDKPFPPTLYVFLAAGVCIGLIVLLINSSYGRAFKAIRDDEIAAEAMGINLARHKMIAFCVSSFFAGVGGAMLAMYSNSVQAKSFTTAMTYEILLMVVIGGIGSVTGSTISAFLFVACSEWWLRFLDQELIINGWHVPLLRNGFRLVVFSLIIMIVVLFFRQGIMGDRELPDIFNRRKAKFSRKGATRK